MTMIQLIACIGMIAGLFMVLHVSPRELSDSLFFRMTAAPGSIRADINETTRRKKAGFLRREITEAQAVLAASGRTDKFPLVCFTSMLCFALGACIAIAAGNAFLVPVLAVGLMLTPFWYVKLTAGSFKKDVAAELETALSVITTAYLRTENFQQAVEENVRYLHPPVQEVFQHFLMRIKHIDPDMDAALTDLKAAIDNEVWREWCDAVMACQADRSLTSILTPIVSKLSDMRVVNAELENLVFGPRKEFITMAILVLINIPLVRFINKDWYHTLVATIPGQMVIAVCLAAVFVSFAFVVKLTQPIEDRRREGEIAVIPVRCRLGCRTVFRFGGPAEDPQAGNGACPHLRRTQGAQSCEIYGDAHFGMVAEAGSADPLGCLQTQTAGNEADCRRTGYDPRGLYGLHRSEALSHPAGDHPVPPDLTHPDTIGGSTGAAHLLQGEPSGG